MNRKLEELEQAIGYSFQDKQMLTHAMTHITKCAETFKEHQKGLPFPVLFGRSCFLHDLRHEVSHLLRSIPLHLPCCVRISAKGKACIAMSEHTADRFHVRTVLEC